MIPFVLIGLRVLPPRFGPAPMLSMRGAFEYQAAVEGPTVRQLPNLAWELAESNKGLPFTVFHLDFNAAGLETDSANGCRHLMEHLLAYGKNGDLETRLEADGGFLTLQTFRTGLDIEIDLPNEKWELGFSYLKELVNDESSWTAANIGGEKTTIAQEEALMTSQAKASSVAWTSVLGKTGADPIGDLALLKAIELPELQALAGVQLVAKRASLSISSTALTAELLAAESQFLNDLPPGLAPKPPATDSTELPKPGEGDYQGKGSARATLIAGIQTQEGLEKLAAALAITSQCEGAYLDYLPTTTSGVITIGSTNTGVVEGVIDSLGPDDTTRLFVIGRNLLGKFLTQQIWGDPALPWRGLLLAQGFYQPQDQLLQRAKSIRLSGFSDALKSFALPQAEELKGQ